MYRILLVSVLTFALLSGFSQDAAQKNVIEGFAPDYLGEPVRIMTYEDYLSKTPVIITSTFVNPEDSLFKVSFANALSKQIIIRVGDVESFIFVSPGKDYSIYFPPLERKSTSIENNRVECQILELEESDINYKIVAFDLWVDDFLSKHAFKITRPEFEEELDLFMEYVEDYYKNETDLYFLAHVRYSLGELQMMGKTQDENVKRLMAYLGYIRNLPILYGHHKYMDFVLSFYDNLFDKFPKDFEDKIYKAVLMSSPEALHEVLLNDKMLENTAIRELVMIQSLGKAFYAKDYPQQFIINILDSIQSHPKIPKNGVIAKNILQKITQISPGSPAPELALTDIKGENLNWQKFKGKCVYLSFFATWNTQSVNEMKVIADYKEKYGKDIEFISISTDENKKDLENFLAENKDFNWHIAHFSENEELLKRYNIKTLPAYFLIDQDGFFLQAPALSPSPNAEYQTIDYYLFEIYKALNPEQIFKVGQLED